MVSEDKLMEPKVFMKECSKMEKKQATVEEFLNILKSLRKAYSLMEHLYLIIKTNWKETKIFQHMEMY